MTANPLNWMLGDNDAPQNFVFKDFSGEANGTPVNGMAAESGQTIVLDNAPYLSSNTATVQSGAMTSSDLTYAVVPCPWQDSHSRIGYTFPVGATGAEHAICIAKGRRVAGGIITKMVHVPLAFQGVPDVSLWGHPKGIAAGNVNGIWDQNNFARPPIVVVDPSIPVVPAGVPTFMDVIKIGNELRVIIDNGRVCISLFEDQMRDQSGDAVFGDGLGYDYFEIFKTQGASSPLPVINSILSRKIGPVEKSLIQQQAAKFSLSKGDYLDLYLQKSIPKLAATPLFLVTPLAGQTPTSIHVKITLTPDGIRANQLQEVTEWDFMVGHNGGPVVIKDVVTMPYSPTSRFAGNIAAALATQTYVDTVVSGANIFLRCYPLVTGGDAGTVTNANIQAEVTISGYPLIPSKY
jgi:hypothetical protein